MNGNTIQVLEFDKIISLIKTHALTEQARNRLDQLLPVTNIEQISHWMLETTEARAILDVNPRVPLSALENMAAVLQKSNHGMLLSPEEFTAFLTLLDTVQRLRRYMRSMEFVAPLVSSYASSMCELTDLHQSISHCIVNNRVDDRASTALSSIRKKMRITTDRIKDKLNDTIRSSVYASMLQEPVISLRFGRHVVPVRRQNHRAFPGQVIDMSSTGATVFMEPTVVQKLSREMTALEMDERNEVQRILTDLTQQVASYEREISIIMETLVHYDLVFAKARFSSMYDMRSVPLNHQGCIMIRQGRHPLLGEKAVPLDFQIGGDYRALMVTGSNTGGKTVTLKTVGLFTLMIQAGLHIPVEEGSEMAVFNNVLADIGDGQSIEQNLSTFSSHVKQIASIVECASADTLVILDELGTGTDPAEGKGFAIAVLEDVFRKGATIIATTHLGEIKVFAENTPGFKNASMAFDMDTLQPLYRLELGSTGDSNALLIALRLGMDKNIINRAYQLTYGTDVSLPGNGNAVSPGLDVPSHSLIQSSAASRLQGQEHARTRQKQKLVPAKKKFELGDCVFISTMNRTGIICQEEDAKGDLMVLVLDKKYIVNHKRLTLYVAGKDLYPEDYDLDIVFESKENRKKKNLMRRKHVEGLVIEHSPGEED